MAASDHLHPILFHGSNQRFKPGDTVKPWKEGENGYAVDMPAFATESHSRAKAFGNVYQVEPHDWKDVYWEPDEGEGAGIDDWAALNHGKGYKVIRKVEE